MEDRFPEIDSERANSQNHYLMRTEVSVGTQSATLVHPREVLGPALREGAASLVLVHNHPSGDPTPSREDLRLTGRLADGATLLDLRLHDHLIIGNGTQAWVSLAQRGELPGVALRSAPPAKQHGRGVKSTPPVALLSATRLTA